MWRVEIARRISRCYAEGPPLAAMAVAGSVGAGMADRWSDLELDCYWHRPPAKSQRLEPIRRVGGELAGFWDYDETDREWSEDYVLDGLGVTVSNFTVSTVEAFINAVVDEADTDPVKHFRLAAIACSLPLHGEMLIRAWQDRARGYPDHLVAPVVERTLAPEVLVGWAAREALVERRDEVALHALLSRIEQAVIGTLLALNRTYQAHRLLKWQRHLLADLRVAPSQLGSRLRLMWADDYAEALAAAESLLRETLVLAEQHSDARLSAFAEALAEHRSPVTRPRRSAR